MVSARYVDLLSEGWRGEKGAKEVEAFLEELAGIPWFEHLGESSERDADVFRIASWDTWMGPEDPGVELMSMQAQKWHDQLFQGPDPILRELWVEIHDMVLAMVEHKIPFDAEKDPWHPPTAAAHSAAWMSAVWGCTQFKMPRFTIEYDEGHQWTLPTIWWWYQQGHWPCSFYWPYGHASPETTQRTGIPKLLIVY